MRCYSSLLRVGVDSSYRKRLSGQRLGEVMKALACSSLIIGGGKRRGWNSADPHRWRCNPAFLSFKSGLSVDWYKWELVRGPSVFYLFRSSAGFCRWNGTSPWTFLGALHGTFWGSFHRSKLRRPPETTSLTTSHHRFLLHWPWMIFPHAARPIQVKVLRHSGPPKYHSSKSYRSSDVALGPVASLPRWVDKINCTALSGLAPSESHLWTRALKSHTRTITDT